MTPGIGQNFASVYRDHASVYLRMILSENRNTAFRIIRMLTEWHEFYTLLGTAAAALVALLFVAASIGARADSAPNAPGRDAHLHEPGRLPLHQHVVSSVSSRSSRHRPWQSFGLTYRPAALAGLVYSVVILFNVIRNELPDVADRFGYGATPVACLRRRVLVAVDLRAQATPAGLDMLAGAALLLLVVNIRNAWDLMLSLARRHPSRSRTPESPDSSPSP